ncbi:MAG: hypothetical protein GTO51_08040 [Candidatus Latescibacteria bacterium]|nr:hypothetical protein [Candidatus Latescibacterota bacterium]NIM21784.1 hypothetical protein [Candidatus Latescibacterota bacterium]NIM65922.1 hypothetical protein [Candidatus Latescibacterota bacterium]NIO02667.1 hypothetical protein [Candidatus Latescibacterota bacterium]NIO29648.1 hypothetical protein [Candidatus Latescibacterota bacterium]
MRSLDENPLDIFIEGWGRMASAWGMSKVMAEIYALLYLSSRPLSLEDMSEKLKTSRSNISLNVRSLQDLGVVRKVVIRGDRRDFYTGEDDIAKVAKRLVAEKKKRELDPAIEIVEKALSAAAVEPQDHAVDEDPFTLYYDRLKALQALIVTVEGIFSAFIDGASKESIPLDELKIQKPGKIQRADDRIS